MRWAVRPWIGTGKWSYDARKGGFCPGKIGSWEVLGHYAQRLSAVEVNSTVCRSPERAVVQEWIGRIQGVGCNDAYVVFKHEDEGTGPSFAGRMLEGLGGRP